MGAGGHPIWDTNVTTPRRKRARSSITGSPVSIEYAAANPDTTQVETDTLGIFKAQVRVLLDLYDQTGDVIQLVSSLRDLVGE